MPKTSLLSQVPRTKPYGFGNFLQGGWLRFSVLASDFRDYGKIEGLIVEKYEIEGYQLKMERLFGRNLPMTASLHSTVI